ncbi:hypothetical protein JTB14_034438 [Gonioctena quinquepunctata]|nr:hypothetical protein JTB14_034438 [Gonioctena quinquepunctata]
MRAFRQALILSPEDPYIVVNTASCCLSAGSDEEAIDLMKQYRSLNEGELSFSEELMDFAELLTTELRKRKAFDETLDNKHCEATTENHPAEGENGKKEKNDASDEVMKIQLQSDEV